MSLKGLPEDLQEIREFLPDMIYRLEECIPYVSALVTQESGTTLRLDSHREIVAERQPRRGIVFSLFNGRFFQEWATDNLNKDFLKGKIDDMCRLFKSMKNTEPRFTVEPGDSIDHHYNSKFEIDPDTIKLTDMVAGCRDQIKRLQKMDKNIINSSINYHDSREYKIFANRNKLLSSSLTTCTFHLVVVGSLNGSVKMNFTGAGGVAGFEVTKLEEENLQELIDDLNLLFKSKPLEPGVYDVISSPQVSGILAHEAFGHGVEADMFVKERALAAQYMNRPIASSLVSMVDDPSLPGLNGHYFFDDEGQLASRTQIIEKGILKHALTDLRSATVLNLPRSANGRRESFERKVYSRMSNTYFDTGESNFDEMLASMEDGLFLKKSSSGMEDPKGWGIQVGISLAREVKKGKFTGNVFSPMTMTGYIPDLLKSITHVGDTLGFMEGGGSCGKGHKEMVRVSAGGPHLRFKVRLG